MLNSFGNLSNKLAKVSPAELVVKMVDLCKTNNIGGTSSMVKIPTLIFREKRNGNFRHHFLWQAKSLATRF